MTREQRPGQPPTRRVGRPARIDRQAIAKAAHEVGLAGLTLKAVADRLGVSVGGLYHHVEGRDDLMRLATEYTVMRVKVPEDRGQHWAVWLREWATYNHETFVAQPALLEQYLDGAISPDAIVDNADTILGVLCRQGFEVDEAQRAYELVSNYAIGAAVSALRDQRATSEGRPLAEQHQRILAQRPPEELTHLRRLLAKDASKLAFEERLVPIIAGIAKARGERWSRVERALGADS
jgi:AcrR family transcriptional regulator